MVDESAFKILHRIASNWSWRLITVERYAHGDLTLLKPSGVRRNLPAEASAAPIFALVIFLCKRKFRYLLPCFFRPLLSAFFRSALSVRLPARCWVKWGAWPHIQFGKSSMTVSRSLPIPTTCRCLAKVCRRSFFELHRAGGFSAEELDIVHNNGLDRSVL